MAQTNMDSLKSDILNSNKFQHNGDSVLYLNQWFKSYFNSEKTKQYDVLFDSLGNFKNCINVAVVYNEFNSNKDKTKRIGYSENGEFAFFDFSPILTYSYSQNKRTTDHYNFQNKFTDRYIETFDQQSRTIEKSYYDKDLNLSSRTTFEFIDSTKEEFEKKYDRVGNLIFDGNYAVHYKKYNKTGDLIIEEHFYDQNMNLVDSGHNICFEEFSIIKRKKMKMKKKIRTRFYNSRNELVFDFESNN